MIYCKQMSLDGFQKDDLWRIFTNKTAPIEHKSNWYH